VSTASEGATNAVGIAFVNSVASVGAFLGPYVVGYALDRTGSLVVVGVSSAVVIALGAAIALSTHERRHVHDRVVSGAAVA
jgi:MFS family permease